MATEAHTLPTAARNFSSKASVMGDQWVLPDRREHGPGQRAHIEYRYALTASVELHEPNSQPCGSRAAWLSARGCTLFGRPAMVRRSALRTLAEPFKDFPFIDDASRSVALAAVLTALVRRCLRAAPLFAYDAPKMASGKTLLITVVSYVATGRGPYLLSQVTRTRRTSASACWRSCSRALAWLSSITSSIR